LKTLDWLANATEYNVLQQIGALLHRMALLSNPRGQALRAKDVVAVLEFFTSHYPVQAFIRSETDRSSLRRLYRTDVRPASPPLPLTPSQDLRGRTVLPGR